MRSYMAYTPAVVTTGVYTESGVYILAITELVIE